MREPLTDSQREWLEIRAYLGKNRFELGRSAAVLYPHHLRVGPTPLLTDRRWVPSGPVPLGDLALRLEKSRSVPDLSGAAAATIALPERPDGSRYESYSEAIADLTGRTFDNRGTYRLQGGDLSERSQLAFGLGMYFDGLDTGEAAAHEFAAVQLGRLSPDQQRIRFAIGDPCDPSRRPTNFAISTLTLRYERAAGAATFLLHRRDPQKVGHAGGLYQVLPTGVFQAAGEAAWNLRNDFDLWRSMIREYAEELLGGSEDYGAERSPIDYDAWPFAAAMTHGLVEGSIRAHVLGLGLDPLTFATDLLTVVVIDSALYDDLFGGLISTFDEGHVVSGLDDEPSTDGVPFAADTVARFVEREPTQAAGAAVLWSAWQHRAVLLE
jgi:hypothetical protein